MVRKIAGWVLSIVITVLITVLISFWFEKRSQEHNFYLANLNLSSEVPKIAPGTIILFSRNRLQVEPSPADRGFTGSEMLLNYGLAFDVAPDGRVLLNGEIRNANEKRVAMLRDSKLFVSPGIGMDVNSDTGALEIVDETKQPILQLVKSEERLHTHLLTNPNAPAEKRHVLRVKLVSYHLDKGHLLVTICDDGPCTTEALNDEQQKRLRKITRLFKYPGYAYPGVRVQAEGQ